MSARAIAEQGIDMLFTTMKDFLRPMTISDEGSADYDPDLGEINATFPTSTIVNVALVAYQAQEIDEKAVRTGDIKAFFRASEFGGSLKSGMTVTVDQTDYEVIRAKNDMFQAYWFVQLRSVAGV